MNEVMTGLMGGFGWLCCCGFVGVGTEPAVSSLSGETVPGSPGPGRWIFVPPAGAAGEAAGAVCGWDWAGGGGAAGTCLASLRDRR